MSTRRRRNLTFGRRLRLAHLCPVAALFVALLHPLPCGAQARLRPRRQTGSVNAKVEAVVRDFVNHMAKEDSTRLFELWSKSSPHAGPFRQHLEQRFAETTRSFNPPVIAHVRATNGRVTLHLAVTFTSVGAKTGATQQGGFLGEMTLVREDGRWKIWQLEDNSTRFAAALLGKTESERTGLLAEEKEFLNIALAVALFSLGNDYDDKNDYPQALNAYQLALKLSRQLSDKPGTRDALWNIGYVSEQQKDYDKAIANYRQALDLSKELGDRSTTAVLLRNIGGMYHHLGNYPAALDYYQPSLALYEELRDKANMSDTLNRIGDVYYNQANYAQALENYLNCLRIVEDFDRRRNTLDDIGDVYEELKDYKTALAYRRKSHAPSEADEKALDELIDKFFAVSEPWDLGKWLSLWSPNSPSKRGVELPMSDDESLGRVRLPGSDKNNEITSYVVRRRIIWTHDKWATIRLSLERKPDLTRGDNSISATDKVARSLDCIKEDGVWKVWYYYPTTRGLAFEISSVETEGDQQALLEEDPGLVNLELTHQLVGVGNYWAIRREYARARELFQLALSLAARFNDKSGVASKLSNIAHTYDAQGEPDKALEFQRQSLATYEALGEQENVAEAQGGLAIIYFQQGDFETALDYLHKANALFGTLASDESKESVAYTWTLIGQIHLLRGEVALAQDYFQKALKISVEVADEDGMSTAWQAIGQIHVMQGDYKQAMQAFKKSQDISGDSDNESINTLIGMTYFAQGTPNLSVKFLQKRLPPTNTAIGEQPDALILGYNNFVQSNYAEALAQFQQILPQQEELGNKIEAGVALFLIGLSHLAQENSAAGVEAMEKSLRLFEQTRRKPNIAEVLMYLAYAYQEIKDYEKALASYRRSLRLYQEMGSKFLTARLTLELSAFIHERGDYEQALKLAESGHALARQLNSSNFLWLSETLLGRSYLALKQQAKAEQYFRLAIQTVETLRTNVSGSEQEKERFFEDKLLPYDGMIKSLIEQGRRFEALHIAEQSKARVLLDVLQGSKLEATKPLPAAERLEEAKLINQLTDLNRRIRRAERARPCDGAARADLIIQRRKARLEFNTFQAWLSIKYPELSDPGGRPHDLSRTEILDLLPDSQTVLLEYVVTDDQTFLFVISKDDASQLDVKVYPRPVKRAELKSKVASFRNKIAPADPRQRANDFKPAAGELYDLLLKPAAELRGKSALIIIPDEELWNLPFQALQTPANRYLLEDYAISYAPSLATLQKMRAVRDRLARAPGNGEEGQSPGARSPLLLALGDPAPAGEARQEGEAGTCHDLPPLSAARDEVTQLKEKIYAGFGEGYVGPDATEERFKSQAGNYRILHLATHSLLDNDDPLFSQIILTTRNEPEAAPDKVPEAGEDGVLEAWEIARLRLNADLVVLSACETARGRTDDGEGVIGLTWALAVAGTPTTVASQWSVNSSSTGDLMVEFHRRLAPRVLDSKARVGPAVALQQAALKIMSDSREPGFQHPYFWAGFIVIGDGR